MSYAQITVPATARFLQKISSPTTVRMSERRIYSFYRLQWQTILQNGHKAALVEGKSRDRWRIWRHTAHRTSEESLFLGCGFCATVQSVSTTAYETLTEVHNISCS